MKSKEIKDLLGEEIKTEIQNLSTLEPGSKEKSTAIDDLAKLYRLRIEDESRKDRYFRLGVEAAGIILPLIFYGIWLRKGFKFEETGTFTSTTFRNLFNRFRPTIK
jgi:hypothetical protein